MWVNKEKYELLSRKASLYDRHESTISKLQRFANSDECYYGNGMIIIGSHKWKSLVDEVQAVEQKLNDVIVQKDWYKLHYEELLKKKSKEDMENGRREQKRFSA